MSHLNISRMVIDNREPGFSQLGGVWLPLTHVLPILLIWNDWAWHSGFAGSVFSMLSYILASWAIYKTIMLLTGKKVAAIIGSLALALNLNMLYLQSTPMTEPMYVGFFAASVLVFVKYLLEKNNTRYLLLLGVLGFFQVLTRYDGWFVIFMEAVLIAYNELFVQKKTIHEILGKLFLFGAPVSFGILLWLMWNLLIFGNPLFFALGPYSAHAQQNAIAQSGQLLTKGNILESLRTYMDAVLHNAGIFVAMNALAGAVVFFFNKKFALVTKHQKLLILLFLAAPIVFNVLALYAGFSSLFAPHVNWEQTIDPGAKWFNIRYGLLALPMIAVLIGLFASWRKMAAMIAIELILLQGVYMFNNGIVTVIDGSKGISSFESQDIAKGMHQHIKPGESVLISIVSFSPVIFKSGVSFGQIIHEGDSREWDKALENPQNYTEWIVMANTPSDSVYNALVMKHNKAFLNQYHLVYSANNSSLYKKN